MIHIPLIHCYFGNWHFKLFDQRKTSPSELEKGIQNGNNFLCVLKGTREHRLRFLDFASDFAYCIFSPLVGTEVMSLFHTSVFTMLVITLKYECICKTGSVSKGCYSQKQHF